MDECENCKREIEQLETRISKYIEICRLDKDRIDTVLQEEDVSKDNENTVFKLQKIISQNLRMVDTMQHDLEEKKRIFLTNFLIKPDRARMTKKRDWFRSKKVNHYGQSGEGVLREGERSTNVFDDNPILAVFDYYYNEDTGKIVKRELQAFESVDVLCWDKNIDQKTWRMKDEYFCLRHRSMPYSRDDADKLGFRCSECGVELLPAYHKVNICTGGYNYYAQNEINHTMYFNPRKYRGRSVFFGIYWLVMAKVGMDKKMFDRFYINKFPDIVTVLVTSKGDSSKFKAELLECAQKGWPMITTIEPPPEGTAVKTPVHTFELRKESTSDLMNKESRREILNTVLRSLGTQPISASDTEGTSALRGQGQQITMLVSEIIARQENISENIFPWMQWAMGVDDYIMKFPEPQGDNSQMEEDLKGKRITNMSTMVDKGFEAKLINRKEMEFEYSGIGTRAYTQEQEEAFQEDGDDVELTEEGTDEVKEETEPPEEKEVGKILKQAFSQKAYADMSITLTKKINNRIAKGHKLDQSDSEIQVSIERSKEWRAFSKRQNPSLTIKDGIESEDERLTTIIRDQGGKLDRQDALKKAEEEDPENKERYDWVGRKIGDPRLSDECENIIRDIPKSGASLPQIKKLIKRHGDPETVDVESLSPHINCSHTIRKKVI
jgi:hypothetical protein